MHQIVCQLGVCPRPPLGELTVLPGPPTCNYGPTSKAEREKQGKREGREGGTRKGGKRRGGKGKRKGRKREFGPAHFAGASPAYELNIKHS